MNLDARDWWAIGALSGIVIWEICGLLGRYVGRRIESWVESPGRSRTPSPPSLPRTRVLLFNDGGMLVTADGKAVDFIRSAWDVRRWIYPPYVPSQNKDAAAKAVVNAERLTENMPPAVPK